MDRPPRLVLTLGDPRGIGPEVVARAAAAVAAEDPDLELLLVGPDELEPDGLPYLGVGSWDGSLAGAGRASGDAVRRAVERCLDGRADGVVTGPIHKPALHAAGLPFPGHTEMLKELARVSVVGMLMDAERTVVGGALRVLLATTHLALRDVPAAFDADLLVGQAALLHGALRVEWEIERPRVALCAFNPHASDSGLFGDEEQRVYAPALERLRREGIDAVGPLPADTVFRRALDGQFDAVVAPYHDVGMAAFKTVSFGAGVNVTLGLPFVRTSPDHGTAFDIAGTGRADPASTAQALRLAARLARGRARSRRG